LCISIMISPFQVKEKYRITH